MKYTYNEIVRILKQRGWTVSRYRWYSSKGEFKHLGISLRDAASLEMLEASESLDTRRKRADNKRG